MADRICRKSVKVERQKESPPKRQAEMWKIDGKKFTERVHAWNQRKKIIPYRQNSSSGSRTPDLKYNKHSQMQDLGLEGTREFPNSYIYIFSATISSLQQSMENEWRAQLWSAYFSSCQSKLDAKRTVDNIWEQVCISRAGLMPSWSIILKMQWSPPCIDAVVYIV